MDRIEQPSRFNLGPGHEQFKPLFFWPAFSPAQAMCNEWILERVALLAEGNEQAAAARARLQEFSFLSPDDRETALSSVMETMAKEDPMHPTKVLHTVIVNGAPIYGHREDLEQVAAAHPELVGKIEAYKIEARAGVDLSHILTKNLGGKTAK